MDRDLLQKARDGRLRALEKPSCDHAIETNVLPLVPRHAPQHGTAEDLRNVFRQPADFEPPAPLATGLRAKKTRPV